MAELERQSGVPRDTIHFYLREGLLPPPQRTGRTRAVYDRRHLDRLRLIRKLREEKFLPILVIRSILNAGLEASGGGDLEVLTWVFNLDGSSEAPPSPEPSEAALAALVERRLLGPQSELRPADPAQARILAVVERTLTLDEEARELTFADLEVCADQIADLVAAEARVFFGRVIEHGDLGRGVGALAAGREAVARYVSAYRDHRLRRLVETLLSAAAGALPRLTRPRLLALGPTALKQSGATEVLAALHDRALAGDPAAMNDWVWLLAAGAEAEGPTDMPAPGQLRPRARMLWRFRAGASCAELAEGADPDFALGQILIAERALEEALRRAGPSLLGDVVEALHRLYRARPEADADPLSSALGSCRRGLVGVLLPAELGLVSRAEGDLEDAVHTLRAAPGRVAPPAARRIEANATLGLAELAWARNRTAALRHAARVLALDPDGPLGAGASALVAQG